MCEDLSAFCQVLSKVSLGLLKIPLLKYYDELNCAYRAISNLIGRTRQAESVATFWQGRVSLA
jgi:hypothetical protein